MHKVAAGKEKKRKEETAPFGVKLTSQVLYRAAQGLMTQSMQAALPLKHRQESIQENGSRRVLLQTRAF